MDSLYHYTSFESAIKIIASQTLLFSKIGTLNDINESYGPDFFPDNYKSKESKKLAALFGKYTQISFASDSEYKKGYDIPAMWGHYASRGHGVCLILDKAEIVKEVKKRGFYSDNVIYDNQINLTDYEYNPKIHGTPENFIKASKNIFFFRKTKDWEYEQEYRIIAIRNNVKAFSIKKSLKAIVLFSKTHDEFLKSIEYKAIQELVKGRFDIYNYISSFYCGRLLNTKGEDVYPIVYDMAKTAGINDLED